VLRVIIFAILSAALAYVSRASLRVPRSHGFYRFFAWECILALFFLTQGKPDARRPHDAPLIWIEKTTQLVTTGAFKYIRHPLYSSLLLLAWGVFLKHPSWVGGGVVLGATVFLLATAKVEEVENVRYFGAAYRAYMQHTKMFIPFVL